MLVAGGRMIVESIELLKTNALQIVHMRCGVLSSNHCTYLETTKLHFHFRDDQVRVSPDKIHFFQAAFHK